MKIGRSLQASPEGIEKARRALTHNSLSQIALAEELKMSRSTVDNFFKGKPVDRRGSFIPICERLNLEWDEIVVKPPTTQIVEAADDISTDIDTLVQEVRQHCHDRIQYQCGKILLVNKLEVDLDDLCVDINILKDIPSQRYSNILEKIRNFDPTSDDHDHFYLGKEFYQRVPGLEVVEDQCKLLVLGKPGSGKTTFLQYVALNCNQRRLQSDRVPIFIKLFRYAEDTKETKLSLLNYIDQEFRTQGIDYPRTAETLLQQGKCLILLDGLDEVPEVDSQEVLKRVRQFCDYYHKNSIIITCRINAQAYKFDRFVEVEVADFNRIQIETFAEKWFMAVAKGDKKEEFIEKLQENQRIFDLAVTPILLNLTCLVFEDMDDFPSSCAELYQQGLDILLRRWDESRGIQRDEVYGGLNLEDKKKLLNHVAAVTFEKNRYFFEQDEIEQYIADYFRNLPNTTTERSQQYSQAVLKSIESQHGVLIERAQGIYSFSHLTFHEYFTAREIITSSDPYVLKNWVSHIAEKRWREVFLLVAEMFYLSPSAENLLRLMKQQIDKLLASDEKLREFLKWVRQKSNSVQFPHKPSVRAFYFALDRCRALDLGVGIGFLDGFDLALALDCDLDLALDVDLNFDTNFDPDLALDRDLAFALAFERDFSFHLNRIINPERNSSDLLNHITEPDYAGNKSEIVVLENKIHHSLASGLAASLFLVLIHADRLARIFCLAPESRRVLKQLKSQILVLSEDEERFQQWWIANGQTWTKKLREAMIEHRNIGHDWQFDEEQKELLKQYYDANKLLVDCLKSGCAVTPKVRSQIEDNLLLPIAEIKQR